MVIADDKTTEERRKTKEPPKLMFSRSCLDWHSCLFHLMEDDDCWNTVEEQEKKKCNRARQNRAPSKIMTVKAIPNALIQMAIWKINVSLVGGRDSALPSEKTTGRFCSE